MKKRMNISIESSEPFTGPQLIDAIQQIRQDFKAVGDDREPAIDTHGNDGVHRVRGWLESEVEL